MALSTIPFSALSADASKQGVNFRNLIINGDMSIAQRGTSSVTASAGLFRIDRFQCQTNAGGIYTVEQSTDAPDNFNYSLKVTSNSAHTLGSGDVVGIWQKIEGNNIAQLNWGSASAQDVTLSFYIKSSVTGTYGVAFRSASGTTVSYLGSYTINSANTWERKTINIDGATIGTWNINNSTGIEMLFGLGVGSTYTGSAGSWSTNNYYGLNSATSLVSTNGATWQITGVQLEVGTSASDFEFLPYDVNLKRCERYFQSYISSTGNAFIWSGDTTSGQGYFFNTVIPEMRTIATLTVDGSVSVSGFNAGTFAVNHSTENSIRINCDCNSTGARRYYQWNCTLDAEL